MSPRAVRGALLVLVAVVVAVVRILPLSLHGAPGDRAHFTWHGPDGREHVYLGDYDSYLWVREARNYLRTGTTCDAIVAGECRDTFTNAPLGLAMRYARSLHIAAIVGLHRLITVVEPHYPLTASAFWVPVVVGVMGVVPAFAIAAHLAGPMAGVVGALAIGMNPLFLTRSMGGDNDVWNVTLPLCAVWAAIAALAAAPLRRRLGLAALAGAVVGLHAATWSGWIFTHVVVLAGFAGSATLAALRALAPTSRGRSRLRDTGLVLVAYGLVAALATALAGAGSDALLRPFAVVHERLGPAPQAVADAARAWPDVFRTVGELARPDLRTIADAVFGPAHLFVAWLGLLLLLLPTRRWQGRHVALLIGGTLLYRVLVAMPDPGRITLLALLGLPLGAAVALSLLPDDPDAGDLRPGGLVVAIWFLAALFQAFEGHRLIMLLVPPFGLLLGVASGRFYDWLRSTWPPTPRPALRATIALVIVGGIVVAPVVSRGIATGRSHLPVMHDAWWDTLAELRESSPPDAIVITWWDYGHWVKYVAERRVHADGSTLATHVPHWLGRALLAPTERETVGLLRMLGCGSDATPAPEGRHGAWGRLVGAGIDPAVAHAMLLTLANLDRDAAHRHLLERGLAPAAAAAVLEATHCTPPASYLVLSSHMALWDAWWSLGWWDARRAWVTRAVRERTEDEVVADLISRFAMTPTAARALYRRAARLQTVDDMGAFTSPRLAYLLPRWFPCDASADGPWSCRIGMPAGAAGSQLLAVEYDPDAPRETRLRMSGRDRAPAALLIAGDDRLREPPVVGDRDGRIGVLVDVPGRRVLLGSPDLLRSTFTRLVFLDGRLSSRFELVDDRAGFANERVRTWKVR